MTIKAPTLIEARKIAKKWLLVYRHRSGRWSSYGYDARSSAEDACATIEARDGAGAVFRIRISKAPKPRKPDPRVKRRRHD